MFVFTIGPGFGVAAIVRALWPAIGTFWFLTIAFLVGGLALLLLRWVQARRR